MASKRIKGITIEIGADTRELTDEIKKAEKQINDAAYKLRDINKLLKLDPKNTELLTQKQKYLLEAIDGTKEKLKEEKKALEQLQAGPQTKDAIDQQEALGREIAETTQKLDKLKDEYKEFGSVAAQKTKAAGESMKETGQKIMDVGSGIRDVGSAMTRNVTAPIVAGLAASAKKAIDWETAFTGVRKTVDATEEEYAQLEKNIKQMSTEMASSKEEIAGVMEIAGQLGVRGVDNLTAFTRTAVMLGDTTNLSSEEAATALARVLNITGDGYDKIDKLGSVIVDLGNNYATTESEITEMATRLASAGKVAGFTTQEIFAISAAMSSVGIEAEAGGTAMAQTFKGIQAAVSDFTKEGATEKEKEKLETLAKVAGTTADEFVKAWKTKPMDALQSFIKGLSTLRDEGGDTFAVLDELGMSGIRQSNMLQALALASGMMGDATETANKAWNENTALTDEAAKRYATMAAKLTQLREKLGNLALTLGERLMPYIEKFMGFLDKVIEKLEGMSDEEVDAAIKIGAFLAAIGPVLLVVGNLLIFIGRIIEAVGILKTTMAGASIFSSISAGLSNMAAAVSGALSAIGAQVSAFLAGIGGTILTACATIGASIVSFFAGAEIGKSIGTYIFPDDAELYEHYDGIKGTFLLLKDFLVTLGEEIVDGARQYYANLKEATELLNEELAFLWEDIKAKVLEIWDSIKQGVTEKVTALVEGVKEHFGYLKGFFQELIQNAFNWGSDLINSIKEGIMSKINAVKEAASNVGNAIKERLHFSQPDVGPLADFNSWMPDMMSQMAQQINAGIPGIASAMQNVAGTMAGQINPDYSGQLASINNGIGRLAAAGGGNITIPVYIGQQKLDKIIVDSNQKNNFRNGGR